METVCSLLFFLLASGSCLLVNDSKTICPNEGEAKNELGHEVVEVAAQASKIQERLLRFPKSGAFDGEINCIYIVDTSGDNSGGIPEISDGGLKFRFVEVKLTSKIGRKLSYDVSVYKH